MELRRCFNEVDGDHDGQIDVLALVVELRFLLKDLGKYQSEEQLREIMDEMDEGGNGTIELRELLTYFHRHPLGNGRSREQEGQRSEANALFATLMQTGKQKRGVDERVSTPDPADKLSLQAVDDFLKREFDLDGGCSALLQGDEDSNPLKGRTREFRLNDFAASLVQ